ncbi:MAG: hypothetical protein ACYDEV_04315, partial [Acidiferrobacter sp.]
MKHFSSGSLRALFCALLGCAVPLLAQAGNGASPPALAPTALPASTDPGRSPTAPLIINFNNADIHQVLDLLLRKVLGYTYVVSP